MASLLVTRLVADSSLVRIGAGSSCRIVKLALRDGFELVYWHGHFEDALDLALKDDSQRICFSFNCALQGQASCVFEGQHDQEHVLQAGSGNISFGPGRTGRYRQQGTLANLSVMLRPDMLSAWTEHSDTSLRQLLACGGFATGHRGGELAATAQHISAQLLACAAPDVEKQRHPLWFQGQATALVGLFLEARNCVMPVAQIGTQQARLSRARDLLLADLAQAPSLAALAAAANMSEATLLRGFRRVFACSPYAMFQRERMQAARVRLQTQRQSVATVAADFGYTNASHFAAAFRAHFGMLPGLLKRNHDMRQTRGPGPDAEPCERQSATMKLGNEF
ncbi:MAG: AraC family transcriptional regulator [Comamonas sp.]